METSEPLPHGAVEAPDLAELVRRPGPFLSLYLTDEVVAGARLRWTTG